MFIPCMAYRRTAAVEARLERTRDEIVRAARHVVARDGLHGLTIAAVADRAGVAVGTVYRHLDGKDALLREVVDAICAREIAAVGDLAAPPGPSADRLRRAVDGFARRAVESGRVAYAVIAEPAPAEVEETRVRHRRDLAGVFAAIVAEGVAAGELPEQDPSIAGTAIVGAVSEVLVGPLAPSARRPADVERVLTAVHEFTARAVGAATSDPPARTTRPTRTTRPRKVSA